MGEVFPLAEPASKSQLISVMLSLVFIDCPFYVSLIYSSAIARDTLFTSRCLFESLIHSFMCREAIGSRFGSAFS